MQVYYSRKKHVVSALSYPLLVKFFRPIFFCCMQRHTREQTRYKNRCKKHLTTQNKPSYTSEKKGNKKGRGPPVVCRVSCSPTFRIKFRVRLSGPQPVNGQKSTVRKSTVRTSAVRKSTPRTTTTKTTPTSTPNKMKTDSM